MASLIQNVLLSGLSLTLYVPDNSRATSENKTSLSQRSPMSIARFVQWYITTEDVWNFNARFSFWAQKDSLFDNTVSSKWDVPWHRNKYGVFDERWQFLKSYLPDGDGVFFFGYSSLILSCKS